MFANILGMLSADMAIDLGTVNTLIHHHDNGIILNEPSILAVDKADLNMGIIAIGSKAKEMQEKMKEVQEKIKGIEVEGKSGGNLVKVILNNNGRQRKRTKT